MTSKGSMFQVRRSISSTTLCPDKQICVMVMEEEDEVDDEVKVMETENGGGDEEEAELIVMSLNGLI